MEKFEIVMVAWGQHFLDLMNRFFIPSLLAPGNLPAWPYRQATVFVLYTTAADWGAVHDSPALEQLRQLVPVEFRPVDAILARDKYQILSEIHMTALRQARAQGASVILPMPDVVMADGCMQALAAELAQGAEVVVGGGPRLCLESFAAECSADPATGVLAISPRQGVELLLRHLHPITRSLFWDGECFTNWPSNLCYWQDDTTLVFRCFHSQPFLIRLPALPAAPQRAASVGQDFMAEAETIDGSLLQQFMERPEKLRVIDDERVLWLSLTPAAETSYWILAEDLPLHERQLILDRFARERCLPVHRWIFGHPIRLHGTAALAAYRPPRDNGQALAALAAIESCWRIEALCQQGDFPGVIAAFLANQAALDQHIRTAYFYQCFYAVATAYFELQRWDALLEFLRAHKSPLKTLFCLQFAYRLPIQPPPGVPEPGYLLILLEEPALSSEMVKALPPVRRHVYLDASNLADQEQLAAFYAQLGLTSQPSVIRRQDLGQGALAACLAGADALALSPVAANRDMIFWGTLYDKEILFI